MAKRGFVPAEGPTLGAAVDADTLVRSVLFVAVFLTIWISFHPFQSLAAPPPALTEGDRANQIGFSALFVALAAWTARNEPQRLMLLVRPALIAVLAWCAVSVATSWEPALAARRFAFALVVMGISAMALLLPKNLRHFSDLMAAVALVVLAINYLGLVLAPELSIHQASDFIEPEHAGNWRGAFAHKNEAGATMVLFICIGLFVARMRNFALGALIVGAASVFLAFTQSKTALGLLPLVFLVSAAVVHGGGPATASALVLAVLVIFNLFSVGSAYFEPARQLIEAIMPDPSFTGRTDIWQFAVERALQRPLFGYGFSAFWGTDQVMYGMGERSSWVNAAEHAHNAYLNLALSIGIPGMILVIVWIVILPILDFYRLPSDPCRRPLQILFLRVCMFGVFTSCFESVIFQEIGEGWFLFMTAAFGLRYLSVARTAV